MQLSEEIVNEITKRVVAGDFGDIPLTAANQAAEKMRNASAPYWKEAHERVIRTLIALREEARRAPAEYRLHPSGNPDILAWLEGTSQTMAAGSILSG